MPYTVASPIRHAAEKLMKRENDLDLDVWIHARRADGRSWDWIAAELHNRTAGVIAVSGNTVRSWAQNGNAP